MLQFIVLDDNIQFHSKIKNVINKKMFLNSIEYEILLFEKENQDFKKIIDNKNPKIYILDIELQNNSGIEIAKNIRKKDYKSAIIFLTAHYELAVKTYQSKLLIFDFISKFDDYETELNQAIDIALNNLNKVNKMEFFDKKQKISLEPYDILSICYDSYIKKTTIKTNSKNNILNGKQINFLPNNIFIKTNQNSYVNYKRIEKIDYQEKKIIFDNGEIFNDISEKGIKALKDNEKL